MSITTLNIETDGIRGLITKGKTLEWWGSIPLAPGVIRDGTVLDQQALGEAINEMLKDKKTVDRNKIVFSLTGLHFTFRILPIPKSKPAELAATIRRAAKKEMPLPLEELYLSWQQLDTKGDRQDVFVLGVPKEPVDLMKEALKAANIKPYIMDVKALALARVADCREALLLDLEPDNFGITLVVDGVPSIMRTFIPRRGDTLLEDNVRRLAAEVVRTVEFFNRDHVENPLSPSTPVFLTGAMADNEETTRIVQGEIEYPLKSLLLPFVHDSTFPVASYAVNIGLALRG